MTYSWTRIEARSLPFQPRKMWNKCETITGSETLLQRVNNVSKSKQSLSIGLGYFFMPVFSSPETVLLVFNGIALAGTALVFIQHCTTAGDRAASACVHWLRVRPFESNTLHFQKRATCINVFSHVFQLYHCILTYSDGYHHPSCCKPDAHPN